MALVFLIECIAWIHLNAVILEAYWNGCHFYPWCRSPVCVNSFSHGRISIGLFKIWVRSQHCAIFAPPVARVHFLWCKVNSHSFYYTHSVCVCVCADGLPSAVLVCQHVQLTSIKRLRQLCCTWIQNPNWQNGISEKQNGLCGEHAIIWISILFRIHSHFPMECTVPYTTHATTQTNEFNAHKTIHIRKPRRTEIWWNNMASE